MNSMGRRFHRIIDLLPFMRRNDHQAPLSVQFVPIDDDTKRVQAEFLAMYESNLKKLRSYPLRILVWGPGIKSTNPVLKKRLDIKRALVDDGHAAHLSEDFEDGNSLESVGTRELAQARAAQIILILVENAPGALAETERFCSHPDIASKAYVLAPLKVRHSFVGQSSLRLLDEGYGGVYWYHPYDLEVCNVKARAMRRVRARQQILAGYATKSRIG